MKLTSVIELLLFSSRFHFDCILGIFVAVSHFSFRFWKRKFKCHSYGNLSILNSFFFFCFASHWLLLSVLLVYLSFRSVSAELWTQVHDILIVHLIRKVCVFGGGLQ